MTCLICHYFQPIEPAQHKQDREAGRCEAGCGNRWNQHTAIEYIRNHGGLNGWCRLHPEPKKFAYNHVCGDIKVVEHFCYPGWGVVPIRAEDNLFEWAQRSLQTVVHGTWREQHENELEKQNAELRRQLKRAREISASRLKRLKTDEPPVSPPEQPAHELEPFRPRLVAAE